MTFMYAGSILILPIINCQIKYNAQQKHPTILRSFLIKKISKYFFKINRENIAKVVSAIRALP